MKEIKKPIRAIGWIMTRPDRKAKRSAMTLIPGGREMEADELVDLTERWLNEKKERENYRKQLRKGKVFRGD